MGRLLFFVFQETADENCGGGSGEQAEALESQYPHVKRSLQQGEAPLYMDDHVSAHLSLEIRNAVHKSGLRAKDEGSLDLKLSCLHIVAVFGLNTVKRAV